MKIQQMAFMIVAVFLFFVLVGLFFLQIQIKGIRGSAEDLAREQAISSLRVIADMTELNYDSGESMTLDEDKLRIMSGNFSEVYDFFWPVASIGVYKVYPAFDEVRKCPSVDCNYYEIWDPVRQESNGASEDVELYSTYVSICENVGKGIDDCEIGKLVVGIKLAVSD